MFDLSFSELLIVAIVAILVIGPKELPRVMRTAGQWMGKGRAVLRQFRGAFDDMVRDAELEEMERSWAEHNAQIMQQSDGGEMAGPVAEPPAGPSDDGDKAKPAPPAAGKAEKPDPDAGPDAGPDPGRGEKGGS